MANEMRINLSEITGSGPSGRILMRDVKAFIEAPSGGIATPPVPVSPVSLAVSPPVTPPLVTKTLPIPRLRAAVGRRMTEAKQQIPHFYDTHQYDVQWLVAIRQQFNALLPEEEKVSINDFIIKAVALTLRQYPNLNASLQDNQIIHHGSINIGVAVAVEGGLLTVVCREADGKSLIQIAGEVKTMAERARSGKVKPEDIEGSTFSVSNLGMFEVENFNAIINPPEAAILAVGSAKETPIVKDGQIIPGWRMKATISVDHRISDGVEAARFLQSLSVHLEQPLRLLM
jgi:pyruvate dehydrogenase E2 component (dihydrolipoamide acetyltransferase)